MPTTPGSTEPTANVEPVTPIIVPEVGNDGGAPEGVAPGVTAPETPATVLTPAETPAEPASETPEGEGGESAPFADFTLPEGLVIEAGALSEFQALAKAKGLNQDEAQSMITMASAQVQKVMQGYQDAAAAQIQEWGTQARVDPLVGGAKFDENVKVALSAVTRFGDAELTKVLNDYGLGNNPAFIRAFYRIGKAAGEAGFVDGQGSEQPARPVNREAALADRMAREQARGT